MDLKEEDILGDDIGRHWYYRSKAAALRQAVWDLTPQKILDVGAGSGFFSRHLLAHTAAQSALCVDTGYRSDAEDEVEGKKVLYRRDIGTTDCDLVLMMDVLEHVDDDRGLVKLYADKVPSGAHFLVTVPAFRFLWSGHDVFLEHKRRYRLPEIEAVMRDAGLDVVLHCASSGGAGSFKSQMKRADASGAAYAVILGEDEIATGMATVKVLRDADPSSNQHSVALDSVADYLIDHITTDDDHEHAHLHSGQIHTHH